MQARKAEYQQYLQTPHWQATRKRRLAGSGYRCEFLTEIGNWDPKTGQKTERCEATTNLEVHHLHYDSKGHERDHDLQVLCRFHHCVQTILDKECVICGDPIYPDQAEAIEMVREAVIEVDGDINKVDVDNIWAYPERTDCAYHEDVLSRDN